MKTCPDCGSGDVEEFLCGWFRANETADGPMGDLVGELDFAELYDELHFCNCCDKPVGPLVESYEIKNKPRISYNTFIQSRKI